MIATNPTANGVVRAEHLRDLLRSSGPHITVFLPPNRPGEPQGDAAALLKAAVHASAQKLADKRVSAADTEQLLDALKDPTLAVNSHWSRAILRSRDVLEQFLLTQPAAPFTAPVHVGSCFYIRPMIPELAIPPVFYVVSLSKTQVVLFRCSALHVEKVALPDGIPSTLEEWLGFKPPDHLLENRSSAGTSAGSMRGVYFGTGAGPEREKGHRDDFYKAIDRALRHDAAAPLILAGVDVDVVAFRHVASHPHIAQRSIPRLESRTAGAAHELSEILEQAYAILHAENREANAVALLNIRDRHAPAAFSNDLDVVLPAAFDGRVSQLYVNEIARKTGAFNKGRYRGFHEEDLLNLAAAETILHGGAVHAIADENMPDHAAVIAILRY